MLQKNPFYCKHHLKKPFIAVILDSFLINYEFDNTFMFYLLN